MVENKENLVQTNIDPNKLNSETNIVYSKERFALAHKLLKDLKDINEANLWSLINQSPIKNNITVSGTYMCPANKTFTSKLL